MTGDVAARDRLIEQILDHLQLMASEVDRLTGAAAGRIGVNRTDVRALQVLRTTGGLTAGELARALQVTSGATTRVIDSLVEDGHARRGPDPGDRRRVLVKLTPAAERTVDRTFEGVRTGARAALDAYADQELATVSRFLADVRAVLRGHTLRLSGPGEPE